MGTVLFPKGEKKRTVFITVFLWLGIVPNNTNLQCFRHHNSSMAPLGTVPRMLLVNSPPVTNLYFHKKTCPTTWQCPTIKACMTARQSSKFIYHVSNKGKCETGSSQQVWRNAMDSAIDWFPKFTRIQLDTSLQVMYPTKNQCIPQYLTHAHDFDHHKPSQPVTQ
jgi:hypothetical protein